MTRQLDNQPQDTVDEVESKNPKSFLITFGSEKKEEFTERSWFKILTEVTYAYMTQPAKSFNLTALGRQNLYVFQSLESKKIGDFEVEQIKETGNVEVKINAINFNANNVFTIHQEVMAQIMRELKAGNRKLEYITYDEAVAAEINQTLFTAFSDAIS